MRGQNNAINDCVNYNQNICSVEESRVKVLCILGRLCLSMITVSLDQAEQHIEGSTEWMILIFNFIIKFCVLELLKLLQKSIQVLIKLLGQ